MTSKKELKGIIMRLEYKVSALEGCMNTISEMFEQQARINNKQDAINEQVLGLIDDLKGDK